MPNCPKCGWESPEVPFYYCRKGKAIDCTKTIKTATQEQFIDLSIDLILDNLIHPLKIGELYGKPPFKCFKCYPITKDYQYSPYASYEFGIEGHTWLETHKCPKCKKEFSFDNADF